METTLDPVDLPHFEITAGQCTHFQCRYCVRRLTWRRQLYWKGEKTGTEKVIKQYNTAIDSSSVGQDRWHSSLSNQRGDLPAAARLQHRAGCYSGSTEAHHIAGEDCF